MRLPLGVLASAVAAAGLVVATAPPTSASTAREYLACGSTITVDTTLSQPLYCDGGPAVRVEAPGVVFDLGGQTIFGSSGIGVVVSADGAVVRNGTVDGFEVGVLASAPEHVGEYPAVGGLPYTNMPDDGVDHPRILLDGLEVKRASSYGFAVDSATVTMRNSSALSSRTGVLTTHFGDLDLNGGVAAANDTGVQVLHGSRARLRNTTVRYNDWGVHCSLAQLDMTAARISDNDTGAVYSECAESSIRRSVFLRNEVHLPWFGEQPSKRPSVGCTLFLGGGPAPAVRRGSCF